MLDVTRVPLHRPKSGGILMIAVDRVRELYYVVVAIAYRIAELIRLIMSWQRLNVGMQTQQQTQWCWAAVATSVAGFYDASTTWTQCSVVNAELGQTTCCTSGSSAACNKPWYLDLALTRVGHFDTWSAGAMSFADVRAEIDAGRPLGVRIGWSGNGGHFLVIEGYRNDANQQVAVDDPWYGASDLTYATLSTSYQGSGTWTHSYETQP